MNQLLPPFTVGMSSHQRRRRIKSTISNEDLESAIFANLSVLAKHVDEWEDLKQTITLLEAKYEGLILEKRRLRLALIANHWANSKVDKAKALGKSDSAIVYREILVKYPQRIII